MVGQIGYIDANNILHINNPADINTYGNYTLGNSGITVNQALAGANLSTWNKPIQNTWSLSNVAKNLPSEIDKFTSNLDTGFTKYALIGAVALIALAVLK